MSASSDFLGNMQLANYFSQLFQKNQMDSFSHGRHSKKDKKKSKRSKKGVLGGRGVLPGGVGGAAGGPGVGSAGALRGVARGDPSAGPSYEALAKLKDRLRKVDAALVSLLSGGGVGGGILGGGSGVMPQVVIPRNPSPFGVFAAGLATNSFFFLFD